MVGCGIGLWTVMGLIGCCMLEVSILATLGAVFQNACSTAIQQNALTLLMPSSKLFTYVYMHLYVHMYEESFFKLGISIASFWEWRLARFGKELFTYTVTYTNLRACAVTSTL